MKKIISVLIVSLIVIGGLLFTNREVKNETSKKPIPKILSAAEMKASLKKWEASPDGVMVKKWKDSPAGKKVNASTAVIRNSVSNFTNMEAVVTSVSLPPGSKLGFGIMVKINNNDYILSFGAEELTKNSKNLINTFKQLKNLKVNDKISIKSHSISQAPKYSYPIVSGDYVAKDSKIIYQRAPRKGGC